MSYVPMPTAKTGSSSMAFKIMTFVGAALAVWDWQRPGRHPGAVMLTALLAVLICLSTVLIKQHALLDVLGGLVLAAGTGWFVYRPVKSFSPNNRT